MTNILPNVQNTQKSIVAATEAEEPLWLLVTSDISYRVAFWGKNNFT